MVPSGAGVVVDSTGAGGHSRLCMAGTSDGRSRQSGIVDGEHRSEENTKSKSDDKNMACPKFLDTRTCYV